MTKKLITLLSAVVVALPVTFITVEANANTQVPTVAILDTALDTSLPIFKDKIVHEVCILEGTSCPNGQNFMEGPGSTVLPFNIISKNGFDHGTQMASVAIATNPNIKIVFIRIIGNNASGSRQTTGEKGVSLALKWVLDNKSRFNIQSIAMSQSNHAILTTSTDYCPSTETLRGLVSALVSSGTPVFFPAGNLRDLSRISWPACINDSISIGMADQYEQIDNFSNFDKNRLDFFALGNMQVAIPGGSVKNAAGTSISTQVAAATWAGIKHSNPSLTYQQVLDILNNTSKPIRGSRGQEGKLISSNPSVIAPSTPVVAPVAPVVAKPVAPVAKTPEQLAAEAKAALTIEANKAIAEAEARYQAEIKLAADKLAAIKLDWAKKING
jgi:hypothetical protein